MTRTAVITPILAALCLAVPAILFVPGGPARSQVPEEVHTSELAMRAYMVDVSEQLGVTCNYCHDTKNFKSDTKRAFKVAKDHMRIVDLLYAKGFEKHIKVDCRMCHRGEAKPNFKELGFPISPEANAAPAEKKDKTAKP